MTSRWTMCLVAGALGLPTAVSAQSIVTEIMQQVVDSGSILVSATNLGSVIITTRRNPLNVVVTVPVAEAKAWVGEARRLRDTVVSPRDPRDRISVDGPSLGSRARATFTRTVSTTGSTFSLSFASGAGASERILLSATAVELNRFIDAVDSASRAFESPRPQGGASLIPSLNDNQPYFDFQVEFQVRPARGNGAPPYPPVLRASRITGTMVAQFVVDTAGRAEMATFRAISSDHQLFTEAVRSHLPNMVFIPAQIGGRKVRQLVQMPFVFTLSGGERH